MNREPKILGEITVGHGVGAPSPFPAVPRIIGTANVANFKVAMGICPAEGCVQIKGHTTTPCTIGGGA